MYAVVGLLSKHESMSTEDFRRWWHEDHVPHVKQIPGVVHYVTYPIDETRTALETDSFSPETDVDGIAIIYYESREAYRRALESKELKADKQHLRTGVTASVYYGVPHVHVDGLLAAVTDDVG